MAWVFDPPASFVLASLLFVAACVSAWRGTRLFGQGLRDPEHPEQTLRVVRGIRGTIVAAALVLIAFGILYRQKWLLIFGFVFLGEELLETGVMIFVLRRDGAREAREARDAERQGDEQRESTAPPQEDTAL